MSRPARAPFVAPFGKLSMYSVLEEVLEEDHGSTMNSTEEQVKKRKEKIDGASRGEREKRHEHAGRKREKRKKGRKRERERETDRERSRQMEG